MKLELTGNGKISKIMYDHIMINQIALNDYEDDLIAVYLRLKKDKIVINLMDHINTYSVVDDSIQYQGEVKGIEFNLSYITHGDEILVDISISNVNQLYDIIATFDIGLGEYGYLSTNEAYASQYLDHKIISREPLQLQFRKTVLQQGKNPGLITSQLNDFECFSTDGTQLFGSEYRDSKSYSKFKDGNLPSEIYQYEFALLALQSKPVDSDKTFRIGLKYIDDINLQSSSITFEESSIIPCDFSLGESKVKNPIVKRYISGESFTAKEVEGYYAVRDNVEKHGEEYLSFFNGISHVVTKSKEMMMERNHGHIISSGNNTDYRNETISSTNYMSGYFGGQISVGNTDINQLITPNRNALNVNCTSGIRIYQVINGERYQLTIPSIYEMGLNYAKWIYKIGEEIVEIIAFTSVTTNTITYQINSPYQSLVSIQYDPRGKYLMEQESELIRIKPSNLNVQNKCPNLNYAIHGLTELNTLTDDTVMYQVTNKFAICGSKSSNAEISYGNFEEDVLKYNEMYDNFLNKFQLDSNDKTITKFNTLTKWYLHNALVHYATPRGLEQYVGAAWGTRDVLQGPLELFLTLQKYQHAREIITKVYGSQFEDGNWSQWFMFDEYIENAAPESHGDVIVWPIKALANYIKTSGDKDILKERVPYKIKSQPFTISTETFTILEHFKVQWAYIQNHLLEGTSLPCYGDGDWDDTLQPKDTKQRENMASGWTVALLFEALSEIVTYLDEDQELQTQIYEYLEDLKRDYYTYLVEEDVCSGFIIKEDDDVVKLLHPSDKTTGISYRLLPINRGIISGLFNEKLINKGLTIINEELKCNDGIRLMNKPAQYNSGFNKLFQRAEQASTVGREVGLQYVHAHIRYVEAMAKLGKDDVAFDALNLIQPIDNDQFVKNTMLKQRNVYFSSSEGNFKDRYEFQENFNKLKDGTIETKTGWRIYSSGPGIYLNQLISNVLGIRVEDKEIIIDPVLPQRFDGTSLKYRLFDKLIEFNFVNTGEKSIVMNGETEFYPKASSNIYRDGEIRVSKNEFIDKLALAGNTVTINY